MLYKMLNVKQKITRKVFKNEEYCVKSEIQRTQIMLNYY